MASDVKMPQQSSKFLFIRELIENLKGYRKVSNEKLIKDIIRNQL